MRADAVYRIVIRRTGIAPPFLADRRRLDRVEVLDVETSECVLFWYRPPREASKLARAVRRDLRRFDAGPFLSRWT